MQIKEIYFGSKILDDKNSNSKLTNFDFKVVSFELGSDHYLVDIMQVKEIRKSSNFTYVPNAKKYVAGLDNLRGEIIPIIDLRIMFNLEFNKKDLEDIMVLKNEDLLIGVIVDKINNVFSIDSSLIQDPHPVLSQDSLINYIKGVVDYNEKLYILLDVFKIFNYGEEEKVLTSGQNFVEKTDFVGDFDDLDILENCKGSLSNNVFLKNSNNNENLATNNITTFNLENIKKNLSKFSFNASLVNDVFLEKVGVKFNMVDTDCLPYDSFLNEFYSKSSGNLWGADCLEEFQNEIVKNRLNFMENLNSIFNVLEIGCGNGRETMALVNALSEYYVGSFKLTAIDNDLLKVVETSRLIFSESEISISEIYRRNSFEQSPGIYKFKSEILNNVLFEYSDALFSDLPGNLGMVFLKDVLCFLGSEDQISMLNIIASKTIKGALLVLGDNEELKNNDIFIKEKSTKYFNLYRKV
ncbi:CheR family methyltransferase [Borreliella spielmanii]|uniref:Purine-binding chemotaxis protein n=1 Tax=Borreliella spielmanii A14S TaxID=498742 RepID=B9X7V2_9SPIR|nr:CheR family methyltransferase [Borreliella spielmanii]EEF84496.1 purine-binding chemotaxis protein [Borreliella spielmanii A14S]WKC83725.1 CheR family methyltransferase [Borreliella spielmanii]